MVDGAECDLMAHPVGGISEQAQADIAAVRDAAADVAEATATLTVGYCFGGAHPFVTASSNERDVDAALGAVE